MEKKDKIRSIAAGALLSVVSILPAQAEPVTVSTSTSSAATELAMRWLGPARPETPAASPEEKLAAAIRMMISGGQREGFAGSGGYHTQPAEIWQNRQQ